MATDIGEAQFRGRTIIESKVEPFPIVHWRGHGYPGFESTSTTVRHRYGDTVDDISPDVAVSSVSGFNENDD